jgi:hypothetical protein
MTDNESAEFQARQEVKALTFYRSDRPHAELQALSEDLRSIQDNIMRPLFIAAANKEEQLLVEVLQEYLGRLVIADDFKDCQLKHYEVLPDEYIFAHKGIELGVVKKEIKFDYDPGDLQSNVYSIKQVITFRKIKPVE